VYLLLTLGLFARPAASATRRAAPGAVPVRAMGRLVAVVAIRSTISVGIAGLGAAADRVGLVTTLAFLFFAVPLPALLLALGIPETATRR
jgi:hypothetical protein